MIEWAASSSVLILVVVIARRCLLGKISPRLQYMLWALVLVRLLLPMSFGSTAVSILNTVERSQLPNPVVGYVGGVMPELSMTEPTLSLPPEEQYELDSARLEAGGNTAQAKSISPIFLGTVLMDIWAAGAAALGLWLAGVNVYFAAKLRRSRQPLETAACPLPVYVTWAILTPCLFGLLRPSIYVTEEIAADATVLRHSLAHELTHYRHRDHVWAILRGLCLVLHWYNPLAWLAAALSRRDGELCCDEATVKHLGEKERASYGRTLLAVTCRGRGNFLLTATSMTGSGKGIRERVVLLVKRPRTTVCALTGVILLAAAAVGCTFTGAEPGQRDDMTPWEWAQSVSAARLAEENTGFDTKLLAQVLNGLDEAQFIQETDFSGGTDMWIINYYITQYPFLLTETEDVVFLEFEGAFWRIHSPELYVFVREQSEQAVIQVAFADLDRDGTDETIQAVRMNQELWQLVVTKADGTELFREDAGTPHLGWNSLYLLRDEQNGDCLLRYNPAMATGIAYYSYTLFTLEGGAQTVIQEGALEFELSQVSRQLDALVAFAGEVNSLLRRSALLLSTQDGALTLGPEPVGAHLERLSGVGGFEPEAGTMFVYQGQNYDLSAQNAGITTITGFALAGQYLVFEGYAGPQSNIYCLFDTETKTFEKAFQGANLTFLGDDITTGIYSFQSGVYAYDGTLLASCELEPDEQIFRLQYSEDFTQIIVYFWDITGNIRTTYLDLPV